MKTSILELQEIIKAYEDNIITAAEGIAVIAGLLDYGHLLEGALLCECLCEQK